MQPLNKVREGVLKQVAFKRDLEEGRGQRSKPENSQCKSPAVEKPLTFHQLSREHAGTKNVSLLGSSFLQWRKHRCVKSLNKHIASSETGAITAAGDKTDKAMELFSVGSAQRYRYSGGEKDT